jgi:hypothetical protein
MARVAINPDVRSNITIFVRKRTSFETGAFEATYMTNNAVDQTRFERQSGE